MRRIVLFLSVASLLAAQQPPAPKADADKDTTISTTFRYVLVPVTVTDKSGSMVDGLTTLDFILTDNGKPQRITEDVTTHPLSLVVAIQANRDVEQALPQIKKLASVFEALVLGDAGEMAVVAFDHRVTTLTDFTSDTPKIDAAFKQLKPGSYSSNLNDAAMSAVNMLRNRPSSRRRVLLLMSENRDKGSEMKYREVLSAIEFANITVYSVNISELVSKLTATPQPPRPNPVPPEARQLPGGIVGTATTDSQMQMGNWIPALKDIFLAGKSLFTNDPLDVYTRYTGGREFPFKTQKALEKDISQLGVELHSQYFLTYLPNNQDEGGFHQIVVTVRRGNVDVRTRDGYWLAGPNAEKGK